MPDIEKLIESTKFALAKILDEEIGILLAKEEITQDIQKFVDLKFTFAQSIAWASQGIDIQKGRFKERMQNALDELKAELVRNIAKETLAKVNAKIKYEVVILKVKSELIPIKPEQYLEEKQFGQMREIVELREGDIPISYQTGSIPISYQTGSITDLIVQEIVVLRPMEDKSDG